MREPDLPFQAVISTFGIYDYNAKLNCLNGSYKFDILILDLNDSLQY